MFKVTWARLCIRCTHGRVHVFGRAHSTECMHGRVHGAARRFVTLGRSLCTARLFVVGVCAWTRPRFGSDARIGCTRAKLYGYDWAMWLIYRNVYMQLKRQKTCNWKWTCKGTLEKRINKGLYIFTSFFSIFFLRSFIHFFFRIRGENNLPYLNQKRKILTWREKSLILISYLTHCNTILII